MPLFGAFKECITPGQINIISPGFNITVWLPTATEYIFSTGIIISMGVCQWGG